MRNWPISELSISTSKVQLRWPTLEDLDDLADRGAKGVHAPDYMPFFSQWTDGDAATVAKRVVQRHWGALGTWRPDDWTLYLVVVHEGTVVGSQSIGARDFAATREVLLTSWLGYEFHGRGIGTHARASMLHLAFEGLDAEQAMVVIRQDNGPSQGVCRKFGFVQDGTQINAVRGRGSVSDRYRLDRKGWEAHRLIDVEITGLKPGLSLFGLGSSAPVNGAAKSPAKPADASALSGIRYLEESDLDAD